MDGGTDSAWRRLNAALFKLEQVLSSIDHIASANFPHGDAEIAIQKIRAYFEDKRKSIRSIPRSEGVAVDDLQEYLRETRDEVRKYTKYLGIILRSTNVRNSFEVYHPLKRLSQRAVADDTRLIISSEWEFTPFTYPMNVSTLPNFIIVGTPATESQNLLVMPLAGHEIGHSVWKSLEDRATLEASLRSKCEEYVKSNKEKFSTASSQKIEVVIIPAISIPLLAKAEEVFCDIVGLHIFGTSYFYAFEYFLAPGVNYSTREYPPSIQRLRVLIKYAKRYNIEIPDDILDSWNQEEETTSDTPNYYEFADLILNCCLVEIFDACEKTLINRDITKPDNEVVSEIEAAFRRGEPYGTKAKLSEVINALWRVAKQRNITTKKGVEATFIDIEIALKTIEISEYYSRLEEN